MRDIICNTSPLQYLSQLDLLHVLRTLAGRVIVPPAVMQELTEGRALGVNLPDLSKEEWLLVRRPVSQQASALVSNLGSGETEVLMLGLESRNAVVVLDDAMARRVAQALGLALTGTLGLLLDAKRAGLVQAVGPLLDQLQALRFRVAAHTREAVLKLAGEASVQGPHT